MSCYSDVPTETLDTVARTMRVTTLATGQRVTINAEDFHPALHAEVPEDPLDAADILAPAIPVEEETAPPVDDTEPAPKKAKPRRTRTGLLGKLRGGRK